MRTTGACDVSSSCILGKGGFRTGDVPPQFASRQAGEPILALRPRRQTARQAMEDDIHLAPSCLGFCISCRRKNWLPKSRSASVIDIARS